MIHPVVGIFYRMPMIEDTDESSIPFSRSRHLAYHGDRSHAGAAGVRFGTGTTCGG
jgi:hypothetical protein